MEERYGHRSTIVTGQLPIDESRHDPIDDPTYAEVILDRLVHNVHCIDFSGGSCGGSSPNNSMQSPSEP